MRSHTFKYYLGGAYQGSAVRRYDPRTARGALISSLAFFCPKCGEIWARIDGGEEFPWYCAQQRCPLHGTGSLNHPYDYADDYPSLPRKLLERELDLAVLLGESYWGLSY